MLYKRAKRKREKRTENKGIMGEGRWEGRRGRNDTPSAVPESGTEIECHQLDSSPSLFIVTAAAAADDDDAPS